MECLHSSVCIFARFINSNGAICVCTDVSALCSNRESECGIWCVPKEQSSLPAAGLMWRRSNSSDGKFSRRSRSLSLSAAAYLHNMCVLIIKPWIIFSDTRSIILEVLPCNSVLSCGECVSRASRRDVNVRFSARCAERTFYIIREVHARRLVIGFSLLFFVSVSHQHGR